MLNALDNLPEDPVELRRVTELLASEVKAQALMIEKLQHQLHGANRHRFGSKSEGMDQLQLLAENEEIAEAAVKAAETAPAEPIELKEKPRRKPLPDHLERIEQVLSVGEDCPECGGDLSKLGEDITEELEYIPGRFVVNKITRPRMACRRCEAISQAPMPSRPIERGRPGPGLLAHVLVSKFADHLPLYRQSQIYAREGVDLDRSTMADWVGKSTGLLEPLAEAIAKRAGAKVSELCRKHGMSDATFYKWKARYGGLQISDVRRLKDLESENGKLKKLLAETMLDNAGLKGLLAKNF